MNEKQREKLHRRIAQFHLYARRDIPAQTASVRALIEGFGGRTGNMVLVFLVNTAISGVINRLVIELCEVERILDRGRKDLGDIPAWECTPEVRDLIRIRNGLLAHKMEKSISTDAPRLWYQKEYGSHESMLQLFDKVGAQLGEVAGQFCQHPRFLKCDPTIPLFRPVFKSEVEEWVSAMRKHELL